MRLMERPAAYRLWQSPFARRKVRPMLEHNDLAAVARVLDVGCGPATNRALFDHADYLGLDLNPAYVADARRRYGDQFRVADVTRDESLPDAGYDCILVNSLLHHVSTPDARRLLSRLSALLTDAGHVHILDLVMPESASLARLLARWDRGEHARPVEEWRRIFDEAFEPVLFEPFPLGLFGVTLWNMVYFKGRRRS